MASAPQDRPRQTRLNININAQTEAALRRYAAKHELTVPEVVRRFVGMADSIEAWRDTGHEILVRKNGSVERVAWVY